MKFQLSSLLFGLAASIVSAQDTNQTGPFYLQIVGQQNSSIVGYALSCHTGAALEGLCYRAGQVPDTNAQSYQYWFNYTGYTTVDDAQVGQLIWKLPYTGGNGGSGLLPQVLSLENSVNSNVASTNFGFSGSCSQGLSVGFDADGKLFSWAYIDDSTFTPGTNPFPSGVGKAYYQWYVCWIYYSSYYYQAVAWASSTPPHNPTCQPVEIRQVFPS
ncbi:uncharacterized protein GGS22DRAFT_157358 [Annulohypoxylon maeteangense]|uniref:uncharacterized protein n=1 Tax=Annulohypoxylon maeteangense TaxID=1927788 RepID=UPI002007D9C2|nr:uncharacterized protein GGS22DRAFT_157358 [Annulohypoxylon maeteangense]KAI0887519.1 hypothetical protein GGS22DRAFT_157358 [Annulohypoxylon maeteangense]